MRHRLQDTISPCFLCEQEEDTVDHILIHCVYASRVWFQCFTKVEIPLELMPNGHERVEDWWVASRKRVPKVQWKDFDYLVTLVCWNLWKQRNSMVFGRSNMCNELDTVWNILRERQLWALARESGVLQVCE